MAHDFDLHAPAGANKRRRIIGRGQGSGRGTTAGKGGRGQKARSGSSKPYLGFEGGQMPLYRRLAHRGFSNYPFKKEWQIVNLGEIEKRYDASQTVDFASLHKNGLIKGNAPVKILGMGNLTKSLTFRVTAVSASAKEKIEKAGGNVTVDPPKETARRKKAKAKAARKADGK